MGRRQVPGVLAVTYNEGKLPPVDLQALLADEGVRAVITHRAGLVVASWGLADNRLEADQALLLSGTNWGDTGAVTSDQVARWLADGSLGVLGRLLPPFGALGWAEGGVRLVADGMGFRQAFKASGDGWVAVSTSANLLAQLVGLGLDNDAFRLQSQLGWQLGQRTIFRGVTKVAPGESIVLAAGSARSELAPEGDPVPGSVELTDAVRSAADLLREFLERYLDEVPDPSLQLTGGQDSRLLLSAIPRSRRRGLKALTLDAPGSRDAEVAAKLAARYGMVHTVRGLTGVAELSAEEWFDRVCENAAIHDCMADPIAHAGTAWAEENLEQGHRLSGLGGEIGRGFYYTGWVRPRPVTRRRAEQLANWRMFANEPVEPVALHPAHRERALPSSLDDAFKALDALGPEWYSATDELYYRHRMQRWAGLGESAVSFQRTLTNPLLDHRFRAIVRGLAPRDKRNSRFLGQLQVALDAELASIPLDNRPAPMAYAKTGPVSFVRQKLATAESLALKVRQRVAGTRRPAPGTAIIAVKVVEHLRERPELLDPVRGAGYFDDTWLNDLQAGRIQPASSSLALLTNTIVAAGAAVRPTAR
jgi:asparagine synthase (glutamine-hydrolysing)